MVYASDAVNKISSLRIRLFIAELTLPGTRLFIVFTDFLTCASQFMRVPQGFIIKG